MKPDRITVSVIQHRLEAIVQEMGEAMLRTAYSQILNSSRDFSTAMFDGQGRPQDGFLRLHDIYGLRLPAELVVLSACSTALGKHVSGEGLVGIVRGFMFAGRGRSPAAVRPVSRCRSVWPDRDRRPGPAWSKSNRPPAASPAT